MKYCYYHSIDSDGHASGAVVKKAIPDIELRPFDYGEFEALLHTAGDQVYFVDAIPQPYKIAQLYEIIGSGLFIIDHHKSSIESPILQQLKEMVPSNIVLSDKHAACRLCWEYFFPTQPVPFAISQISLYDSWNMDSEWEEVVLPYQMGLRLQDTDPIRTDIMLGHIEGKSSSSDIIAKGITVLDYQKQQNKNNMDVNSFEIRWEEYNLLCINSTQANSQLFAAKYDPKRHDFMCRFCLNSNLQVNVSIYTTKEDKDASEIAKRFGGGGHKKAAGFTISWSQFKELESNCPLLGDI